MDCLPEINAQILPTSVYIEVLPTASLFIKDQ